jgi:signal transduction histidine kinase
MLQATLQGWGYEVIAVDDGARAFEVLNGKDPPKIAILDWMMPGLDGLEVCRRLRALERAQPTYVIVLTVKEGKENVVTALENGADDYLTKPFDRDELRARLQVGLRIVGLQSSLATRVQQLEDALSGAAKMEAIGRLAGGVAHDFNNILTVILGCSDLLLAKQALPKPVPEHVLEIKRAAERATELTRQLLAFGRKQVLKPVVINLNQLITQFERMLQRLIGEQVQLRLELAPQLALLKADPTQLEQVLMNLAINARDAMPKGGPLVIQTENVCRDRLKEAGLTTPERPENYVGLKVTDAGCGMSEATQALIFEPFFTTKPPGKGTGLGLATVYGIVKQSEGFIRVRSEVGRGTTFSLYFPAVADPSEQRSPEATADEEPAAGAGRGACEIERHEVAAV